MGIESYEPVRGHDLMMGVCSYEIREVCWFGLHVR